MSDDKGPEKEKKKRPSARDIVQSIFDDKTKSGEKQAGDESLKDSALFRPAKPVPVSRAEEQPLSTEKPATKEEHAKDVVPVAVEPRADKTSQEDQNLLKRSGQILRRWIPRRHVEESPVVLGEWADRSDMPVGIEIGTQSIKAVQLLEHKNGKSQWQLVNCAIRPLNYAADRTMESSTTQMEKILRDIFPKPLQYLTSVSVTSEPTAVTQVLKMPHIPRNEIRQAVAWELQEKFSMRSEDWYFDFNPLESGAQANRKDMSVLIAAIPRNELKLHVQTLKSIGLSPLAVEVKPLPTWELLEDYPHPSDSALLLIELGRHHSYVVVVVEGLPTFIHTMDFSGDTLTQVIQELLRLDYDQAEAFKLRVGITPLSPETSPAGPTDDEAQKLNQACLALRPFADRLAAEIEQAFKYFSFRLSQQYEMRSFSKILLSGKTSLLKGLKEFLSERMGVPVEYVQPLADITIDEKVFNRSELEAESLGLATAIGLAKRKDSK